MGVTLRVVLYVTIFCPKSKRIFTSITNAKMDQKELYKKNRLIAEFHGWSADLCTSNGDPWVFTPRNEVARELSVGKISLSSSELKYHEDWNWLMSVVEKIEEIGHAVEICQNDCSIYEHERHSTLNNIISVTGVAKIYAVYGNVVQFIELYNNKMQR